MSRVKTSVVAILIALLFTAGAWAEGAVEEVTVEKEVEVRVEVPVDRIVASPYPLEQFPSVPEEIGVIRPDSLVMLSLEQQEVISAAFRRAYAEQLLMEVNPGLPYGGDQVHFWWGRDVASYMMSQNLGVDGDTTGEGWGMPNLAIMAMNPSGTQAFLIKDEFMDLFHAGRQDEYGGNGPDGFGYPLTDVYWTDSYKAMVFTKGTMIVEDGAAEFIPEDFNLWTIGEIEVPEITGLIREDNMALYDEQTQAAITEAYIREYQQAALREFNIGVPASDGEYVHQWAGRDSAPVIQSFVGGDSTGSGWGMENLTIMMMNPESRRCFIIKDEFVQKFHDGRQDEHGGNGPDGFGYPLTNEYEAFGYKAQVFQKGIMILEGGVMDFIPNDQYR
jgi:hypothetical protein